MSTLFSGDGETRLDADLRVALDVLRQKWEEVPCGQSNRIRTGELLLLRDAELLSRWTEFFQDASAFPRRGWRQLLYRDVFRGKRIIDFGCGLAFDTIHYAENGAKVVFVDIIAANVEVVRRLCGLKELAGCEFCYMHDLESLSQIKGTCDAIYCCGSLIHAPLDVVRLEAQALLSHLPIGGRWIELGYPRSRWEREGRMPFDEWGQKTDAGAPWTEWHDLEKIESYLAPARFDVVLNLEFHNSDFNWFDLVRIA